MYYLQLNQKVIVLILSFKRGFLVENSEKYFRKHWQTINYCHPINEKASSLIQNYVHFAKQPNGGAFMRDIR